MGRHSAMLAMGGSNFSFTTVPILLKNEILDIIKVKSFFLLSSILWLLLFFFIGLSLKSTGRLVVSLIKWDWETPKGRASKETKIEENLSNWELFFVKVFYAKCVTKNFFEISHFSTFFFIVYFQYLYVHNCLFLLFLFMLVSDIATWWIGGILDTTKYLKL